MSKRVVRILFFVSMVIFIVGQTGLGAKTITVKLATVWPIDHPTTKAIDEVLIPQVTTMTKGAVKVQHYPNFQLGSNFEITQGCQMGSIEMVAIGNELQNAVPALAVAELAYIFDNSKDAWAKFSGPYGKICIEEMSKKGLKHLVWYERGFREISSNKPINTINDLRGFKMRVSQVFLQADMVETWGCTPTIISWNEVYTALQQGVADGQENPIDTFYSSKIYEVNKYLGMTDHQFSFGYLMANGKWWDSLPDSDKRAIQDAVIKFQARQDELLAAEYKTYLNKLKGLGVTITYPDKKPFAEKASIIYQRFVKKYPELKSLFEMLGKKL